MKNLVSSLFAFFALVQSAYSFDYQLDAKVLEGTAAPFIEHSGSGQWDNYLTMNLPFEPMADLFEQVVITEKKQLVNRGEAHITVITPVEYWQILRPQAVSIDEVNQIARDMNIQKSRFEVICLGRGEVKIGGQLEQSYFVVVKSEGLIKIRKKIKDLYLLKGGREAKFDPQHFYSHITLGFTMRDLHEADGVIKDQRACIHPITIIR